MDEDKKYNPVIVGKWKKHLDYENLLIRACDKGLALVYKDKNNSYSYRYSGIKIDKYSKYKILKRINFILSNI
jgi:hypothetical protein